jgi:hypothetical protein
VCLIYLFAVYLTDSAPGRQSPQLSVQKYWLSTPLTSITTLRIGPEGKHHLKILNSGSNFNTSIFLITLCPTFDPFSPKKGAFVGQASCTFSCQNKRINKMIMPIKIWHTKQKKNFNEIYTLEKIGLYIVLLFRTSCPHQHDCVAP